jgi:hypothetical protein
MENNPINISKIKAAGNNLKNIGITLFIGVIILFIQVFYVMNIDVRSAGDLGSIKAANITFMILYIVSTVIIIWNFIDAGINLSSSAEDSSKEGAELNEYLNKKYSLNSESGKMFSSFSNLDYTEGLSEDKYDIILGSYIQTLIKYSNGQSDYIMQGKLTGKYFYLHSTDGRTYSESKEGCIYQLYLNRSKQI